jgi:predicted DNA repair protein MutK
MKETQAGLYLIKQGNGVLKALGQGLLAFAPLHVKTLSVLGTAEMFGQFCKGLGSPDSNSAWDSCPLQDA